MCACMCVTEICPGFLIRNAMNLKYVFANNFDDCVGLHADDRLFRDSISLPDKLSIALPDKLSIALPGVLFSSTILPPTFDVARIRMKCG